MADAAARQLQYEYKAVRIWFSPRILVFIKWNDSNLFLLLPRYICWKIVENYFASFLGFTKYHHRCPSDLVLFNENKVCNCTKLEYYIFRTRILYSKPMSGLLIDVTAMRQPVKFFRCRENWKERKWVTGTNEPSLSKPKSVKWSKNKTFFTLMIMH